VLRAAVAGNRFEENADSGISGLGWGAASRPLQSDCGNNCGRTAWGLMAVESVNNTVRENVIIDNSQVEPVR
jgi:hypothetical protein